jgi:hypothetical protein
MSRFRRHASILLLAVLPLLLGLAPQAAADPPPGVTALSTAPDLVSGGDVLVRLDGAVPQPQRHVRVTVDGRDVTDAFRPTATGELVGLVDGLPEGTSTLRVELVTPGRAAPLRRPAGELELTNHPITGPVLYGPQPQPFFCQADVAFGLPITDPDTCSTDTRTTWLYRSTAGGAFRPLPSTDAWPADVAMTTTSAGDEVPFIVRLEEGTINRAVYQVALLVDPLAPGPDPWTPTPGWNGRLVYTFGGGCNAGWHQGTATGGVLNVGLLARGYALASSTLNVLNQNCNDVISAETLMMVKEHFIETVGVPVHTIGRGGSGGAIQQYLIGENYPGLLDGLTPSLTYPDTASIFPTVTDCRLLNAYFTAAGDWTPAEMAAASGYRIFTNCVAWDVSFANRFNPTQGCPPAIPPSQRYHPDTNPDGLRCTVHDYMVAIFGTDPETGFARIPLDNVGVQYGLQALLDGAISPEQFVALNEGIGGYDFDGNLVPERTQGDPIALQAAYETGRIITGAQGLAGVPIIDYRDYRDAATDIHTRFHTFSVRERLIRSNGHADAMVVWTTPLGGAPGTDVNLLAVEKMDEWLTNLAADPSRRAQDDRLRRARPADLVDGCWDATGTFLPDPPSYDGPGPCNALFPSFGDSRTAAGAPLANDIVKCALAPLDRGAYGAIEFTDEQWQRLEAVFGDGVCDWTQPGVGQVPIAGVWQRY